MDFMVYTDRGFEKVWKPKNGTDQKAPDENAIFVGLPEKWRKPRDRAKYFVWNDRFPWFLTMASAASGTYFLFKNICCILSYSVLSFIN